MSEETARFGLPLIDAGQAQKDVTHNEALTAIDLLVQASVVAAGLDVPPASPDPGQAWVIGGGPTDVWAGQAHAVAGWTGGGWRFVAPCEGLQVWSEEDRQVLRYTHGAWEAGVMRGSRLLIDGEPVVGPRAEAIESPAGGTTPDPEARAAIVLILEALRGHGLIAA